MATAKTHAELRAELIQKAVANDGFRSQLIDDPKAAIRDALGVDLPETLAVEVHEDSASMAHLVLPPEAGLSETDLQAVAGGHRQMERGLYGGDERPMPHTHSG